MYQIKKEMLSKSLPLSIDGYAIHCVAGSGGQAIVYLGSKKEGDGITSIKVYGGDEESYHGFERELNILNQLNHPNVIKIKSFNPSGIIMYADSKKQKRPTIMLEFAYYGDLYNIVQAKEVGLPVGVAKYLFLKILEGIYYLERRNISHRDIKLQNVLIDQNLHVKLIDFGLSTNLSDVVGENSPTRNLGTVYCKAPETYKLEFKCQKIDIFSLGVLLFSMCLGRFPFEHTGNSNEEYRKIREGRENQFWRLQKKIEKHPILEDKGFKTLFKRMCSHDVSVRPNCHELLKDEWLNTDVASLNETETLIKHKFEQALKENNQRCDDYQRIKNIFNQFTGSKDVQEMMNEA